MHFCDCGDTLCILPPYPNLKNTYISIAYMNKGNDYNEENLQQLHLIAYLTHLNSGTIAKVIGLEGERKESINVSEDITTMYENAEDFN